ncbi:hypothetical protein HR12_04125, partial [Microbacterium sp. SUBG005]
MVAAGLYGGMLADAFDRRTVALLAAVVTFASTALLAALAWTGLETVGWLFVLSVVNSAANSIVMATKSAITPRLLPRDLLPAAAACRGSTVGIMVMAGPALAGVSSLCRVRLDVFARRAADDLAVPGPVVAAEAAPRGRGRAPGPGV